MEFLPLFVLWVVGGVFLYQFFVLRKELQKPPRFNVTWKDFIKSVPFGPIPMLAVFGAWVWFTFYFHPEQDTIIKEINKPFTYPMHSPDCICNTKGIRGCDCGFIKSSKVYKPSINDLDDNNPPKTTSNPYRATFDSIDGPDRFF